MTTINDFQAPASWGTVRLGELAVHEKGKKPRKQSPNPSTLHPIPYIDIRAFEEEVVKSWTNGLDCRICRESELLMVWDGARSGLVGKGKNGALGSTLVRLDFPLIENQYVLYFFQLKYHEINSRTKGSGTPHVDPDLLWNYEFPVPPLPEQHRIVAKIEELFTVLDSGIDYLKAARAKLNVYRQSVLKHAFEGKLTAQWREENRDKLETSEQLLDYIEQERVTRYEQQLQEWKTTYRKWEKDGKSGKRPSKPRKTADLLPLDSDALAKLPPLPEGYAYTSLANLGELGRGKSKHRPRNAPKLFGGPYPFIQTGEVKTASRIIREFSHTYSELGLEQSKLWPEGTLCITIAANIAETAFLGFDGCFPDSIVGFTAAKTLVVPEYVELFIKSVRTRIEAYAPATAQKNINLTTLESLVVPLCSIEEQRVIVSQLDSVLLILDDQSVAIGNQLQQIDALRQSILKKAFSGQLVPQDPDDEPASRLLERIKVEKAARSQINKRTKHRREKASA